MIKKREGIEINILINLDSPLNIENMKLYLKKWDIYVFVYKNFEDMIQKLENSNDFYLAIVSELEKEIDWIKTHTDIPIIVVSKVCDEEKGKNIFELGVYDYFTCNETLNELIYYRIKNAAIHYKNFREVKEREKSIILISEEANKNYKKIDELNRRLLEKNKILEVLVEARTKELQDMTNSLISALESANLYNDEDTGSHLERVSEYSYIIAEEIKLSKQYIKEIRLYSPLHDIGKVGIPDAILKKPGQYTKEEFEEMKKHVIIGYNMIKDSTISIVAKNIIKYHHEKWDGSGYTEGLSKTNIPIEARIVAVADVFDALTTKRSYKDPFTIEKTLEIMNEGKGKHFDPDLIDVLNQKIDRFLLVKSRYDEKNN